LASVFRLRKGRVPFHINRPFHARTGLLAPTPPESHKEAAPTFRSFRIVRHSKTVRFLRSWLHDTQRSPVERTVQPACANSAIREWTIISLLGCETGNPW
jgi:hypothetical protein